MLDPVSKQLVWFLGQVKTRERLKCVLDFIYGGEGLKLACGHDEVMAAISATCDLFPGHLTPFMSEALNHLGNDKARIERDTNKRAEEENENTARAREAMASMDREARSSGDMLALAGVRQFAAALRSPRAVSSQERLEELASVSARGAVYADATAGMHGEQVSPCTDASEHGPHGKCAGLPGPADD